MVKICGKTIGYIFAAVLLAGCASQPVKSPVQMNFYAPDLRSYVASGKYMEKPEAFEVVLDVSYSMEDTLNDKRKLDIAKDILLAMNESIAGLKYDAGLRVFGQQFWNSRPASMLVYGIEPYSSESFSQAVRMLNVSCGKSPLTLAVRDAGKDMQDMGKTAAIIVLSDGRLKDDEIILSTQEIKKRFGQGTLLHTICIAQDVDNIGSMKGLAQASGGIAATAEQLTDPFRMEDFLKEVFLAQAADSDRDGVPDSRDRCPDTPLNVPVDAYGCPLDADGDGVPDYLDACPGTPKAAQVDERGCWVIGFNDVLFDFNKSDIKPVAYDSLNKVVDILRIDPSLKIEIQGHTDSIGSEKYNEKLSTARAIAVMEYLIAKGIDAERISASGYGETRPIAPNDTEVGRAKNRRVELAPIQ